jgi:hypothetical protein
MEVLHICAKVTENCQSNEYHLQTFRLAQLVLMRIRSPNYLVASQTTLQPAKLPRKMATQKNEKNLATPASGDPMPKAMKQHRLWWPNGGDNN